VAFRAFGLPGRVLQGVRKSVAAQRRPAASRPPAARRPLSREKCMRGAGRCAASPRLGVGVKEGRWRRVSGGDFSPLLLPQRSWTTRSRPLCGAPFVPRFVPHRRVGRRFLAPTSTSTFLDDPLSTAVWGTVCPALCPASAGRAGSGEVLRVVLVLVVTGDATKNPLSGNHDPEALLIRGQQRRRARSERLVQRRSASAATARPTSAPHPQRRAIASQSPSRAGRSPAAPRSAPALTGKRLAPRQIPRT
jgi:hypothetical protein